MRNSRHGLPLVLAFVGVMAVTASAQQGYQKPPKEILDILNALPSPQVSVSPTRDYLLLSQSERYPSIAAVAEPMLRLAGLRINPQTNGPHRATHAISFTLQSLADGKQRTLGTPDHPRIGNVSWAPDGKQLSFTNTTQIGIELWLADITKGSTRKVPNVVLNAAYGDAVQWLPDSRTLLCQTVVPNRGQTPSPSRTPTGPNVQESSGKQAPVRTYQDLLQTPHDESLFDYYCTSQLVLIDTETNQMTNVGKPAVFTAAEPSPDGNFLLVVRNQRPYSYLLPVFAFPKEIEVWDRAGNLKHTVASLPLADAVPIDGVTTGPRAVNWRPTEPATLTWVEALDGGDPKKKVPHRDRVLTLGVPFDGPPRELAKTEQRFAGLTWGQNGLALLRDYDRDRRRGRTFALNVAEPSQSPRLIWDRSVQDRYRDPGTPVMKTLPNGQRVLLQKGDDIYLSGSGASPKGDRPFLDRFNLGTQKADRLYQCDDGTYESIVAVLDDDASKFITRLETPTSPPNYVLRLAGRREAVTLTSFPDLAPQLRKIKKQLVTYQRADGVPLSFTLYLPPNYKEGERLPTVLWAYPREFTDADTAGQVSSSPYHFTTIGGISHLFFLLQGYAILDNAALPVIGDPETVNNTYVDQIVAGAKAAIDKAAALGVTDPDRVGVGGHSYGAFMTANLLAHSDLFRAGIARSGAYNRTLTPFGFQSERRTIWEAPEMYLKVSPFMFAHKINEPILLIHGEMDNNAGTFPIQSDRMYQAIRGNGGTVRYVTLPHESHGYAARESVEHTLYEMLTWFDKHVKAAPPRGK